MAGGAKMSRQECMMTKVATYIRERRAMGWQLKVEARELARFAAYADHSGHHGPLTTDLALRWARQAENQSRLYQARRLEIVRTFARFLAVREPDTEIPPRGLLGPAHQRVRPYIYTENEIIQLMDEASRLPSSNGFRALTYRTLIGLLASTGLRVCEALSLDRGDFDKESGILTIRDTKFHKSRLVPLHESVTSSLVHYESERDNIIAILTVRDFSFRCGEGQFCPQWFITPFPSSGTMCYLKDLADFLPAYTT